MAESFEDTARVDSTLGDDKEGAIFRFSSGRHDDVEDDAEGEESTIGGISKIREAADDGARMRS